MVSIAQGMGTGVAIIWLPMIMAQHPLEAGEDVHFIHDVCASLGMRIKPGRLRIGGTVQPVTLSSYVDIRLIGMQEHRLGQLSSPTVRRTLTHHTLPD